MNFTREERVLLRIFVAEKDRHSGRPLYCAILQSLKDAGVQGATVLRGIAGFGPAGEIRSTHLLRLSQDLPLVIEAVDMRERIERALPSIQPMLSNSLVTMEKVQILRSSPNENDS